jgi:hypothetical protein
MKEEYQQKDETQMQQLPQSNIQNRTIDYIFSTARRICEKEEPIADHTHQTGSMRAVKLAVSMVIKYMPDEIRQKITQLYNRLDIEIQKIDNDTMMDEVNKKANKTKIEDDISMEILTLCIVTLTYSSISTELKEIKIIGDLNPLIEKVRTPVPVNIFYKEKEDV